MIEIPADEVHQRILLLDCKHNFSSTYLKMEGKFHLLVYILPMNVFTIKH